MPMLSIHSAHSQEAVCLAENSQPLGVKLDRAGRSGEKAGLKSAQYCEFLGGGYTLQRKEGHGRTIRLPAFSDLSL